MPQTWTSFPEQFSKDVISIEMGESLKRFVTVAKILAIKGIVVVTGTDSYSDGAQ